MKKLLLSIILLLLVSVNMFSVPAKRGVWHNIPIEGGTVRAELLGDEYLKYYKTESGEIYTLNANSGLYEPTALAALQQETAVERAAANKRRMTRVAHRKAAASRAVTGKKKGLVVLVQFADKAFSMENPQPLYDDILNKENYTSDLGFVGSVRDYFRDQSNGQLDIEFDVLGPLEMPNGYSYYGANTGLLNSDAHVDELIVDACNYADDLVDFSDYDWDNDGEVDQVCILFAGQGEAVCADANTIWPHESQLTKYGHNIVKDGVQIDTYACSGELGQYNTIDGIGTFCHEFSHCLGIPDMYDVSADGSGDNYGMYRWDIMSSGNYNGNSFIPSAYTSYERALAGWAEPIELTTDTDISGMKALSDEGSCAYIIYNEGNRNEYYLLENRRKTGWDAGQMGEGLLVIHVDYDETAWENNMVNSSFYDHPHLTPIVADNSYGLDDADCAGDVYPYEDNNSLTNTTTPAAALYNKNTDGSYLMNKDITNITRHDDGTISFSFKKSEATHQPDADGNWFYESFNSCTGVGGNDGKWGNKTTGGKDELFVSDNEGWHGNEKSLQPCSACIKTKSGPIISPLFYFADGAELTFKAAPCTGDFSVLTITTDMGTLSQAEFTLTDSQWTECKATLSGNGFAQLTFETGGAFFIDEVKVSTSNTGISNVETATGKPLGIYSIDGRYMGNNINAMGKGLYIVNGKKIIR